MQFPAMKTLVLCVLLAGAFAAPSSKHQFRRGLNKIVGCVEVNPGDIPYHLNFQDISFGAPFHFCSASIYNENWAISAGHCVQGEDFNNPVYLRVVAGDHSLDVDEGNVQKVVLSRIIQHENYNGFTISNDISLLQLSSPLTFNNFVQPIALPAAGHSATGDCIVSGWGTTSEGGIAASNLMAVTVPIMTDDECRTVYGVSEIEDSMICGDLPEGGKDSCKGDSGGPMACSDTGSTYLAGIVSWGYGDARPNYPRVYCEVSYFVDWILTNAQ